MAFTRFPSAAYAIGVVGIISAFFVVYVGQNFPLYVIPALVIALAVTILAAIQIIKWMPESS